MFARSNWKQSRAPSWCADVCSAEQVCFQETPEELTGELIISN